MFRVRFYVPGDKITVGGSFDEYRPGQGNEAIPDAKAQERTQAALGRLLKAQRMEVSHTDDAGFVCYVPTAAAPPKRKARKACPRCGFVVSSAGV